MTFNTTRTNKTKQNKNRKGVSATISFEWMDLLKRTHPQRQLISPVHEIKRNNVLEVIHFQYIPTKRNKSLSFSIVSNFTLLTGKFPRDNFEKNKEFYL